jgi:hypothetical protein
MCHVIGTFSPHTFFKQVTQEPMFNRPNCRVHLYMQFLRALHRVFYPFSDKSLLANQKLIVRLNSIKTFEIASSSRLPRKEKQRKEKEFRSFGSSRVPDGLD